jgi:TonB family protein
MKEINHSKSFTAADIERYLNREMSTADMHAMEKAALEDPFLADAIEGFNTDTVDQSKLFHDDLQELNARLQERVTEKKKVVPITTYWWRIAAAVMLLAGTAGVIYTFTNMPSAKQQQIAKNESVSTADLDTVDSNNKADSVAAGATANQVETESIQQAYKNNSEVPPAVVDKQLQKTATVPFSLQQDKVTEEPAQQQKKEEKPEDQLAGRTAGVEMKSAKTSSAPAMSREDRMNKGQASNNAEAMAPFVANKFSGLVVDADNKPIAGASVILENKNVAVSTDKEGNFNVLMPDSTIKVTVASVGFEPAKATLRNNLTDNRIVLTPSESALDEVVVTGYGKQKRRQTFSSSVIKTVTEPKAGWPAYTKYLEKNKRIPLTDTSIHGQVIISFLVNKNGKPTDLKVEQSLSNSLDAEAKRLLTEGPAWKPLKEKARGTVTISF